MNDPGSTPTEDIGSSPNRRATPKPQVNVQVDSWGRIYAAAWKGQAPNGFSIARQQNEYQSPRYRYQVRWKVRVQRHSEAFSHSFASSLSLPVGEYLLLIPSVYRSAHLGCSNSKIPAELLQ